MSTTRIILLIVAFLSLGACATPYGQTITAPSAPKPVHTVWGDSLSWQATGYPSQQDFALYGRYWHVRPGNSLAQLKQEILEDLGRNPEFMTLALGSNDAGFWDGRDGWTADDEAAWTEVLAARGNTKISVVLPYYEFGSAVGVADLESLERARSWLSQQDVNLVDWKDYVSLYTLDGGGIHVSSGNELVRYDATVSADPL